MKKFAIVFILCFVIAFGALAQDITRSPLEGAWIWDGQGEDIGISELIFFGNVMLLLDSFSYSNEYEGSTFSFSDNTIKTKDGYIDWQYQLSGTRLSIVEYGEQYTFIRAEEQRSPIEGIWKLTGATDFDPEFDSLYILFTRNIMAILDYDEYWHGINILYRGNYIYPNDGDDDPLGFAISGDTLILHDDDEELILTRLY